MYFMVNTAFVNYLDQIDNLTDTLEVQFLMDKTPFEQTLPIFLNAFEFDSDLLLAPKTLKDFIHQYKCKREIFDLEERHDNTDMNLSNKIFLSNNFIINVFSVCYCGSFSNGYDFGNIFVMLTQETQNASK